ncbi:MAG: hypothetical protein R3E95_10295 [Thiolinea sp.]
MSEILGGIYSYFLKQATATAQLAAQSNWLLNARNAYLSSFKAITGKLLKLILPMKKEKQLIVVA